MNKHTSLLWGAIFGGLAVALGAFGAHALKPLLEQSARADTFELAVRYQFYHALALLVTGLVGVQNENRLKYSRIFFIIGVLIFCGSLYILCLTGVTMLGAITPFGGIFLIAGWVMLALSFIKK